MLRATGYDERAGARRGRQGGRLRTVALAQEGRRPVSSRDVSERPQRKEERRKERQRAQRWGWQKERSQMREGWRSALAVGESTGDERVREQLKQGRPRRLIALQHRVEDGTHLGRAAAPSGRGVDRGAGDHPHKREHATAAMMRLMTHLREPRSLERQELVQHAPHRPHVRRARVATASRLFGCHIKRSAALSPRHLLPRRPHARQAKVAYLDVAAAQEDVAWLQVTVQTLELVVHIGQPRGNLREVMHHLLLAHHPSRLLTLLDDRAEVAIAQLHDEAEGVMIDKAVNVGDDVRMRQLLKDLHLVKHRTLLLPRHALHALLLHGELGCVLSHPVPNKPHCAKVSLAELPHLGISTTLHGVLGWCYATRQVLSDRRQHFAFTDCRKNGARGS
eukprot:5404865-Prymnesium_polylepis.2